MSENFWTSQMTLYTDTTSVSGHVLRLLIAEKQCPCDIQIVENNDFPHLLLSVNPDGKLPFLTDKMLALSDYNAILLYLQERFPASEFLPEHPKIRAQIRQVCALLSKYADVADGRATAYSATWRQDIINDVTELLDNKSTWMLGDEFTLVDVFASALLSKVYTAGAKVQPKLKNYMNRLFSRASFNEQERKAA